MHSNKHTVSVLFDSEDWRITKDVLTFLTRDEINEFHKAGGGNYVYGTANLGLGNIGAKFKFVLEGYLPSDFLTIRGGKLPLNWPIIGGMQTSKVLIIVSQKHNYIYF